MPPTRLKRFLFEHGVKQTALAERTGNTPAYISGLCLGRFTPSMEKAGEITAALSAITGIGVQISDLWGPEADNQPSVTTGQVNA